MRKKALPAIGIMILFVALAFQASALSPSINSIETQETTAINNFMDKIEQTANESASFNEFFDKLLTLCNGPDFSKFPVVHEILSKLFGYMMSQGGDSVKDTVIGNLINSIMDRIPSNARPDYLCRLCPDLVRD
jgi:hypothetical protein